MIKCNVTINGTVSRAATVRTNSEGQTFICLRVKGRGRNRCHLVCRRYKGGNARSTHFPQAWR